MCMAIMAVIVCVSMIIVTVVCAVIVVAMLAVTMYSMNIGKIGQLGGGHQPWVRVANARQILGAWLDVQLRQHAITANVGVLLCNH